MELDYDADAINEIEFGLREIHEAILGSGEATTGNTVGSIYRPATLKDIIRVALREDWEDHGWKMESLSVFFRHFVEQKEDISDVICWYNIILKKRKSKKDCFRTGRKEGERNQHFKGARRNGNYRLFRNCNRNLLHPPESALRRGGI